jgi:hypothetical protein
MESWSTYTDMSNNSSYQVSDHAGFPHYDTNHAYFCGGYNIEYNTSDRCFVIDTVTTLVTAATRSNDTNQASLVTLARSSMNIGRGDLAIVTDDNNEYAMVTGGYSNANDWCYPYGEMEMYDFNTDQWTLQTSMNKARGDNVMIEMNQHYYSIGGESELPDFCALVAANNTPGPEQQRLPVNDIEYYDGSAWIDLQDLPEYRFRFTAVSYSDPNDQGNDKVYAFGGQLGYNSTCNCFPMSDEITVYSEKYAIAPTPPSSSGTSPTTPVAGNNNVAPPVPTPTTASSNAAYGIMTFVQHGTILLVTSVAFLFFV